MNVPFFPWLPGRARLTERIANIQDQVIELGTHVRFIEADKLKPQPRDTSGRFVSTKPDRTAELRDRFKDLTDTERKQAIERAVVFRSARGGRG